MTAIDTCGNTAACEQRITILGGPALNYIGPLVLNRQTGLFEQTVIVKNSSQVPIAAVQLAATTPLPAAFGGTSPGPMALCCTCNTIRPWRPAIRWSSTSNITSPTGCKLAAFTNAASIFNPGYHTLIAPVARVDLPVTTSMPAPKVALTNGTCLVEFSTLSNRNYYVQYSSNLTAGATWLTALPPIQGNGSQVQWIDSGPPKTQSRPAVRFYRVVLLP